MILRKEQEQIEGQSQKAKGRAIKFKQFKSTKVKENIKGQVKK